jgi:hypothetical protein
VVLFLRFFPHNPSFNIIAVSSYTYFHLRPVRRCISLLHRSSSGAITVRCTVSGYPQIVLFSPARLLFSPKNFSRFICFEQMLPANSTLSPKLPRKSLGSCKSFAPYSSYDWLTNYIAKNIPLTSPIYEDTHFPSFRDRTPSFVACFIRNRVSRP